eukprot:94678-Prymnesium_polylepis.2
MLLCAAWCVACRGVRARARECRVPAGGSTRVRGHHRVRAWALEGVDLRTHGAAAARTAAHARTHRRA